MGLNLDTNFKGYFLVGHGGGTVACAVAVVTPARVSRPLFLSDVDAGAHSCDRARAGNCPCSCRDGWGIKQGRHESFVLENHDIRYTASSKARALRAPNRHRHRRERDDTLRVPGSHGTRKAADHPAGYRPCRRHHGDPADRRSSRDTKRVRNPSLLGHRHSRQRHAPLSRHPGRCAYQELNVTENPLRRKLLREPLVPRDGFLAVPQAPGLGIELDEKTLETYRWDPRRTR